MRQQRAAILVIVLWFIMIITILVATLASEIRLSSKIVFHQKVSLQAWTEILQVLRMAEMELLIARMPDPPGQENEVLLSERRNKAYLFNGQPLTLAYPVPKNVTVRIYDHAGKINVQRLTNRRMRELLEKKIGTQDVEQLDALEDAWLDWIDRDDLKRANGAEKDYYEKLKVPYQPRNAILETVEELHFIKGFEKVFESTVLENAFTVYNNTAGINPNLATKEALSLLPELDGTVVEAILAKRREKDLKSFNDFDDLMSPEQLVKFRPWINFATSNIYTIVIETESPDKVAIENAAETATSEEQKNTVPEQENGVPINRQDQGSVPEYAYMVTVQARGINQFPKILMVNPYGIAPAQSEPWSQPSPANSKSANSANVDSESTIVEPNFEDNPGGN